MTDVPVSIFINKLTARPVFINFDSMTIAYLWVYNYIYKHLHSDWDKSSYMNGLLEVEHEFLSGKYRESEPIDIATISNKHTIQVVLYRGHSLPKGDTISSVDILTPEIAMKYGAAENVATESDSKRTTDQERIKSCGYCTIS
jgi:hypothetical protein